MTGKRIAILGSTGSIGHSTLQVVQALGDRFRVHALATGSSWQGMAKQIRRWRPVRAAVQDAEAAQKLASALDAGAGCEVLAGDEGLIELATDPDVDVVVSAIVGAAGIRPTLAALRAGKVVALANKEALVVTGALMIRAAAESGGRLVPIDSEHSALLQSSLSGGRREIRKVILTASGGPFLRATREEMAAATREKALRHPTWRMGPKITIDSATLMNKALEIIEARWLFDLEPDQIEVLVHPQSIVHGLVQFTDGSLVAQLGPPDMRLPIQYALTWPDRLDGGLPAADLAALGSLTFEAPDAERFPSLGFARRALAAGGAMPAVMNAANEAAVRQFLQGEIGLTEIFEAVGAAMDAHTPDPADAADLDAIFAADQWARRHVEALHV